MAEIDPVTEYQRRAKKFAAAKSMLSINLVDLKEVLAARDALVELLDNEEMLPAIAEAQKTTVAQLSEIRDNIRDREDWG